MAVVILLNYGFLARICVVTDGNKLPKVLSFCDRLFLLLMFWAIIFQFNKFGGSSQCFHDTARSSAFLDISVLKTTNNLLEEACIADGNLSTSKVFAEELQSCLENGEEMLGIFVSRLGLACGQNSHMRKTIRPAMQAVLEGDSKTNRKERNSYQLDPWGSQGPRHIQQKSAYGTE